MKRLQTIAAAFLLLAGTSGCTTVAKVTAEVATNLSSSTPVQVTTYAAATQAATLATKAVTLAVDVHKFDKATLVELSALNDAVHAAWLDLKTVNDNGGSLAFGSFNAALDAFNAYATTKGVKH